LTTDGPEVAGDLHAEAAYWAARMAEAPLHGEECERFEAWLNDNPQNISCMEDILRCWGAVEHYAAAAPIMALREEALAAVRERAAVRSREWREWSSRAAFAAASLLLMIMGVGLWMTLQPVQYRTGIGERRVVTLADGSILSLDAGSAVSVQYSHGERELSLDQGRAKFVVAKDPLRPFTVRAGSKLVVATGTEFSVERIGGQVRVILYKGHVALLDANGENYQQISVRSAREAAAAPSMSPNEEVVLPDTRMPDAVVPAATVSATEAKRSMSWESGLLVFNDQPLDDVVARVNRYADQPLRIGDSDVRQLRVSGVFRAGDTTALLQGLQGAFHVRVRKEADSIAIYADGSANK
jgi:transmembrane sensor